MCPSPSTENRYTYRIVSSAATHFISILMSLLRMQDHQDGSDDRSSSSFRPHFASRATDPPFMAGFPTSSFGMGARGPPSSLFDDPFFQDPFSMFRNHPFFRGVSLHAPASDTSRSDPLSSPFFVRDPFSDMQQDRRASDPRSGLGDYPGRSYRPQFRAFDGEDMMHSQRRQSSSSDDMETDDVTAEVRND